MIGKAMNGAGFRDRLFRARLLWEGRNGRRLTQAELGSLYKKTSGEAVAQSTISDWINGVTTPTLEDIEHLARILGPVDPGWLAFGDASKAPRPTDPVREGNSSIPHRKKP